MTNTEGGTASSYRPPLHGRRQGRRLRPGRRALLAVRLPELAITLPESGALLDPAGLFAGSVSDVWLEIGFGSGEHLASQALAHPSIGFIGCEAYMDGVAALLQRIEDNRLPHVRIFADDARRLLEVLPRASIAKVFLLFPDPWPKRRHHRRRFMQEETIARLAGALRPGGELLFATDHMEYARWALALVTRNPLFRWCATRAQDWREPPRSWIGTRYEAKAHARGACCVYLRFLRVLDA